MFSCEFSKISKNTFFTEHLRTTASAFSFSEAAIGGVLWKKVFLKISQISQENTFGSRNFQKHLLCRTPLDDYFSLFRATLLKWGTANSVWKNSDGYSLPRNTNCRSTVQVYHFFLGSINFQCMFSFILASSVLCRQVSDSWITEASDAIIIAVKVSHSNVSQSRGEGKIIAVKVSQSNVSQRRREVFY